MRDFKGMKRQRGRNNRGGNGGKPQQHNANRAFDSNGPEGVKVRGAAQSVYEKYQQLARDASSSGDRVLAENYLQHAEHYFRVLRAIQPNRPVADIVGKDVYSSAIRDMHFGNGSVCSTVSRNKWAADAEERGLVYCESGECILVPTVCRNVSRISRAGGATGAAAAGPGELAFDPPAAGEPVAAAPDALESLPPTGAGTPAVGLAAVPAVSPGLLGPIAGNPGGGQPVLGGPISIPSAPVLPSGSLPTVPVVPPPVPEPGTWALMLGGIALLALLRQRRLAVQPVRTGRRG